MTAIQNRGPIAFGGAALDMTALTEDTDPDEELDFIFTFDASAAINKKAKPKNFEIRPFLD